MAKDFEPSIQRYSTDIYKLQQSPLIEEHMFLLFCIETPPHDVSAPPPLKGTIVYESHWDCALSVSFLLAFISLLTTLTTSAHLVCVCVLLFCVHVCET